MAKTSKRRLLLVCASPTAWDEAGRLQGATDLPMSDDALGRIAEKLQGLVGSQMGSPIAVVLLGPDEASRAVGRVISQAGQARVQEGEELREVDLGLWTGLRVEELEERFERAGRQWLDDPASVSPPEGETIAHLEERLLPVLDKAVGRKRSAVSVAVVLRPIAYAYLRTRLENAGTQRMHEFLMGGGEAMWFDITPRDPRLQLAPEIPQTPTKTQAPAA